MKGLKYLLFSCFSNGKEIDKLRLKKLELQAEEESLLTTDLFASIAGVSEINMNQMHYSRHTGKEICLSEKLRELGNDIKDIREQIKVAKAKN